MHIARSLMGAAILLSIGVVAPSGARAMDYSVGSLKITAPWSRATPAGSKTGAGYMVVRNEGAEADRLVSAETPAARRVEMHATSMKDGVMSMRQISGGIVIAPGQEVMLAPGGQHMMFIDIKAPLKQGDKIPVTLRFEKAGKVDVELEVQAAGAGAPGAGHGSGHKM
jgi:copper(I)-binding protein